GLSAIAANNYENLYKYLHTKVTDPSSLRNETSLVEVLYNSFGDIHNAFKTLPGHERQFVPVSEYLYKFFQPMLDDLLFVGGEYEAIFDRLEILIALEYGHERVKTGHGFWTPFGRFGWKSSDGTGSSPLHRLITEGKNSGASWAPLKAGMLDGSFENFEKTSSEMLKQTSQRPWF
ncbi:MAG TPA: hypothetical protein VGA72_16005, partial [Anaerolineales bacterium]